MLDALAWLETMQTEYPDLVVQEYLTTTGKRFDPGRLKLQYGQSQGVSTTFQYLPIIFYRARHSRASTTRASRRWAR